MNSMFVFVIMMCIQLGCSIMFIPPACIGQQRVCSGGSCHCVPAPMRDLSSFNTLNMIGNAIGNRDLYNPWKSSPPPTFSHISNMYQTSRDSNTWKYDFDRKHAL